MKDEDEQRMKKMDERKKEYIPTTGNRKNIIFFFSTYIYMCEVLDGIMCVCVVLYVCVRYMCNV